MRWAPDPEPISQAESDPLCYLKSTDSLDDKGHPSCFPAALSFQPAQNAFVLFRYPPPPLRYSGNNVSHFCCADHLEWNLFFHPHIDRVHLFSLLILCLSHFHHVCQSSFTIYPVFSYFSLCFFSTKGYTGFLFTIPSWPYPFGKTEYWPFRSI